MNAPILLVVGLCAGALVSHAELPGLKILQIDLARQMETTSFLSNYVDRVAAAGFDTLELYLEGRVQTKTFAMPAGEGYSVEEMKGLVAHAREKGVMIIPVVSLLGHAEMFFRYPGFEQYAEKGGANSRLGGPLNTFCLSNPKTREFLTAYVGELCEIFTGPYFHAGFDEAWNSGTCPLCREKELKDEYFAECVLFAHDLLKKNGKRMLMWDDFFGFHPKALAVTPKDVVMCHWNYDGEISERGDRFNFATRFREDSLAKYAALGYDALICPWNNPKNIRSFIAYARRNRVAGFLQTQWEDLVPNFHGGSFVRAVAAAKILKNPVLAYTDEAFVEAVRETFPSLNETEVAALVRFLEEPEDELALRLIENSKLKPGTGAVDADPLSERAFLDDIVLRGRREVWKKALARAQALLGDPRRNAEDIALAKRLLAPLPAACEAAAARRDAQFDLWRKGCTPRCVTNGFMQIAREARELIDTAAPAKASEKRLELQLTMTDWFGMPFWEVFGKFSDGWRMIAKGSWKPTGVQATYVRFVTFESDEMPGEVRLEYHGYGPASLRYLAVEDRTTRFVPAGVKGATGLVQNALAVLRDDYSDVKFGEDDFMPAYYDNQRAKAVSSLTVSLKKESFAEAK